MFKRRLLPLAAALLTAAASSVALTASAQEFAPTPLTPEQVGSGPRFIYLHSRVSLDA